MPPPPMSTSGEAKPKELAVWKTPRIDAGRSLHDIDIQDGLLYGSWWNDGLVILAVGATQDWPNINNHCSGGQGPTADQRRWGAVCAVIFIAVFGVMFYSILKHRKSVGHKAANFHESVAVEIAWTIVPFIIVCAMGFAATKTVVAQKDTSNADLTIKATGYQWKWGYDYLKGEGEGIGFLSTLDVNQRNMSDAGKPDLVIFISNAPPIVKIVTGRRGKILGGHIIGPDAGNLIHEIVLAMRKNIPIGTLSTTIHVYPTLAQANQRAADNYYRPRDAKVAAKYAKIFPKVNTFTVDEVFGSWAQAQKAHFNDGAAYDQIVSAAKR